MREYKVSQAQVEIQGKKIMMRSLPVMLIAAATGIYIASKNSGSIEMDIMIPIILVVAVIIVFSMRNGVRSARNTLSSIKIELSENSIKKYQAPSAVEIQKSEVVQITEDLNKYITIKTSQPNKTIGIPVFIDGYSEIRDALSQWMSIKVNEKSYSQLINIGVAVVVVVGLGTVILCNTSYIVIPVGIAMIAGLIWSFVMIQKSPHVEKRIKRTSFIIVLPLFSIAAKVLSFILR